MGHNSDHITAYTTDAAQTPLSLYRPGGPLYITHVACSCVAYHVESSNTSGRQAAEGAGRGREPSAYR